MKQTSPVCSISRQLTFLIFVVCSVSAWAAGPQGTVLYQFSAGNSNGDYPEGALVADKAGNFYGTTAFGGNYNSDCSLAGCGIIFELSPPSVKGGSWTESVIYPFQGASDGHQPACTLMIDSAGNLYGTSSGTGGITVFELSPPSSEGQAWAFDTLYTFSALDGDSGDLLRDQVGNLYGTSYFGGSGACGAGCGTVFEVSPPAQQGGAWTGAIIYNFQDPSDGLSPYGGLVMDRKGSLYGTTVGGGDQSCNADEGCGTVFQLVPPTQQGGAWTKNLLYAFHGTDGSEPYATLIFDKKGNLYGTTNVGGPPGCADKLGCGTAFELSPPAQPGGAWTDTVLYDFRDGAGRYPLSTVILDPHGNAYGTASAGGLDDDGIVFELSPQEDGTWVEKQFELADVVGGSAATPFAGLIFGPGDTVLGTATGGFGGGAVFSVGP